jgi:hypothetical protein
MARFDKISHPNPPAPMTKILHVSRRKSFVYHTRTDKISASQSTR